METKPGNKASWNMRAIVIIVLAFSWLIGGAAWYTCSIKQVCSEPLPVAEQPPAPEPVPAAEPVVAQVEEVSIEVIEVPVINEQTPPEPEEEETPVFEPVEEPIVAHIEPEKINESESPEPVEEETPVVEEPEEPKAPDVEDTEVKNAVEEAKVVEVKPITPLVISRYRFGVWEAESALSSILYERVTEAINRAWSHTGAIRIVGHADPIGPREVNVNIAQARANHMREILIRHGIDAARIEATNAGSQQPVADNNTVDGRARNRRVEVFFE